MQKAIAVLFALVFVCATCHAGIGARAGVNYTTITAPGISTTMRSGLTAGPTYRTEVAPYAQIQFELLFDRHQMTFEDSTINYSISMDYVRVPALVKLHLAGQDGPITGFLQGGADLGIRIRDRISASGDTSAIEGLSPIDACWILGGGAEIANFLSADIRVYRSLFAIADKDEMGDLRNFGIAFGLGFSF
ncbi:MAG: porin family protein [Candidatus Edwardsbacteria bacterium]|nr:porin family protein [Candidatus Edwardsbacteria bacterium]